MMATDEALKEAIKTLYSLDYRLGHATVEEIATSWRSAFADLSDKQLLDAVRRFVDVDPRGYWPKPGQLRQTLIEAAPEPWGCEHCRDKGYTISAMRKFSPGAAVGGALDYNDYQHIPVVCGVCTVSPPESICARAWEDLQAQGYKRITDAHGAPLDVPPSTSTEGVKF